jgi:hypothetical protein
LADGGAPTRERDHGGAERNQVSHSRITHVGTARAFRLPRNHGSSLARNARLPH